MCWQILRVAKHEHERDLEDSHVAGCVSRASSKDAWSALPPGSPLAQPLLPGRSKESKDDRIASALKGNRERLRSGVWERPLLERPMPMTMRGETLRESARETDD